MMHKQVGEEDEWSEANKVKFLELAAGEDEDFIQLSKELEDR